MPDEQTKPQFEPPPWEREAFERFQKERAEARAAEELEAALREVRYERPAAVVQEPEEDSTPGVPGIESKPDPVVPDARIDTMLIQLRAEEPTIKSASSTLINAVVGLLAVGGLFIIVESALLFAQSRTSEATGTMMAATLSFVVFLTGLGFLGGAAALFRKYNR